MDLNDTGLMTDRDLAHLAYDARKAAKSYARERCVLPGRIFAITFDGFRSLWGYGQWNVRGLTWEQIWEKYELQITNEAVEHFNEEELTRQICLRILERSCKTNQSVDKVLYPKKKKKNGKGLMKRRKRIAAVLRRKRQREIISISTEIEKDAAFLIYSLR